MNALAALRPAGAWTRAIGKVFGAGRRARAQRSIAAANAARPVDAANAGLKTGPRPFASSAAGVAARTLHGAQRGLRSPDRKPPGTDEPAQRPLRCDDRSPTRRSPAAGPARGFDPSESPSEGPSGTAGPVRRGRVGGDAADIQPFDVEMARERPRGVETLLFKQLPRPRLTERSAADLSIDEARATAGKAAGFYDFDFPLFTRDDFFYEEVEQDFLEKALGAGMGGVDARFFSVMNLFRRTVNDNTRVMLLFWAPLFFALSLAAGLYLGVRGVGADLIAPLGLGGEAARVIVGAAAGAFGGLFATLLFFSWPFKVVQQRNLMNLDNYITSTSPRNSRASITTSRLQSAGR